MSIDDVIRRATTPQTRETLAADLARLGVRRGDTLLVHSSLSALGFVVGGAVALLQALGDAVGPRGTLVMAAQTGDLTDPANWRRPAVPPQWVDRIRDTMPPYDPALTPTHRLGVVAELFRTWPGVIRSAHPACSFTARGPDAAALMHPHALDDPFGEASPLARLYAANAAILLLGTGWGSATALHLSERRADPDMPALAAWSPVLKDGIRVVEAWCEYPHDSDTFPPVGDAMERMGLVKIGLVGEGAARLVPLRVAVDFATEALKAR
jgi:aminoglycoside 3-N-acetyltransferase